LFLKSFCEQGLRQRRFHDAAHSLLSSSGGLSSSTSLAST